MVSNLTLINRNANLEPLSNILLKGTYEIHSHNSRSLLLVLRKRPDPHREMLLEIYLSENRYKND